MPVTGIGHSIGMKKAISQLFRFDRPKRNFVISETEQQGTPPLRTQWHTKPKPKREDRRSIERALKNNRERLKRDFHTDINPDIIFRTICMDEKQMAMAVFLTGMADSARINEFILEPCLHAKGLPNAKRTLPQYLMEQVLSTQEMELTDSWQMAEQAIVEGRTVLFLDGCDQCILCDTRGFVSRPIGPPKNEYVVLGPHEAFAENLRSNITLLRRIVKLPNFVVRLRHAGGRNRTLLGVAYLEGVANRSLIREVERRLDAIDTDRVLSSGTLEQLLEDYTFLPMPQMLKTERPDRAAAAIMGGKLVLLCEGSPIACVLPVTIGTLLSSAEDTYLRQPVGTLTRIVRAAGALVSILMPAYFLALALHHPGQLSGEILTTVVTSRVLVFLPLSVEMIFLLLVFQLVREAGLRIPGSVGHAIGIIGGLVLGQAAVAANIVSAVVLIIVALSGLGNFTVPDYSTQQCIAYYRVALCVAATLGGMLGIGVCILITLAMLTTIRSFGVPFFAPIAPVTRKSAPTVVRGKIQNTVQMTDYLNAEDTL